MKLSEKHEMNEDGTETQSNSKFTIIQHAYQMHRLVLFVFEQFGIYDLVFVVGDNRRHILKKNIYRSLV